ncbi:hypothetical protein J5N97_012251 [Dioscorea zingiberensis]|uniref:DYW domain-containing protein n=1 Tax=Dioscorea zingiberensis TaxID=325984 RepID=A0A9D5CPH4_9LILI|nr:hypothetical protein J5N97_012251 [Dioscorea zingiberensis]
MVHRLLRLVSTSSLAISRDHIVDIPHYNSRIRELLRLGQAVDARQLFDEMTHRDIITWNSMIFGYFQNGMIDEARALFDSFAGKNIRTWTIVVSGYAKTGRIAEAREVFESMPERNSVSWNAMISGYVQNGDLVMARWLFDRMPDRDVASWNSMITGYCHAHQMREARRFFELMPTRNLVSWTVMISGHVQINEYEEAWTLFLRMHRNMMSPDQPSFTAAVSAVVGLGDIILLENLRTLAIKTGLEADVVVGTAILNAYTRESGGLESAERFFEDMQDRNEYSWSTMITAFSHVGRLDDALSFYERDPVKTVASQTALLTGYAQNGQILEARHMFEQMPDPNIVSWNAMVAGYAQNGMLDEAKKLFNRMPARNAISWAAMIAACAQNGESEEALELLSELHSHGIVPSLSSFTSGFFACASIGALEMGRQLHSLAMKAGSQFNAYVNNGLITMYAKCKNTEDVARVFHWMRTKDSVSWNSLITGLSQNYLLEDARTAFDKMPNHDVVSWTAIISAYSQAGEGYESFGLFLRMLREGVFPNSSTLTSLLSTCAHGMWNEVDEVRELMRAKGVTKAPGCSWMQIRDKLHSFITGDRHHEQIVEIHAILKELYVRLKHAGYVPDTQFVLHDVEEEQKENVLLCHSEKLALAYGLLATPDGTPLQIMKNLRICEELAEKYLSLPWVLLFIPSLGELVMLKLSAGNLSENSSTEIRPGNDMDIGGSGTLDPNAFKRLAPSRFVSFSFPNPTPYPYSAVLRVAVLDAPLLPSLPPPRIAAMLVPVGRESDWIFSTAAGHLQLLLSSSNHLFISRLILVGDFLLSSSPPMSYTRPQSQPDPSSLHRFQETLFPLLLALCPKTALENGIPDIPFLSYEDDVVRSVLVERIEGTVAGEMLVEDVEIDVPPAPELRRRLRFKMMPNLVQTQVRLIPDSSKDGAFVPEKESLLQPYLAPMVAGLSLIAPFIEEKSQLGLRPRALCLGVGGGALLMFLHSKFDFDVLGVEADPVVLSIAKRHFGLLEGEFLRVHLGDGISFIESVAQQEEALQQSSERRPHLLGGSGMRFDVIMVDLDAGDALYGTSAPPLKFVGRSVLLAAKMVLLDHGIIVVNVIPQGGAFYSKLVHVFRELFSELYEIEGCLGDLICTNYIRGRALCSAALDVSSSVYLPQQLLL